MAPASLYMVEQAIVRTCKSPPLVNKVKFGAVRLRIILQYSSIIAVSRHSNYADGLIHPMLIFELLWGRNIGHTLKLAATKMLKPKLFT